jgi:type I restriction enzyme S subunit
MKAVWEEKNLGDVCHLIGGGTPSKDNADFYTGNIPWATVRDMRSDVITDTEYKITESAIKNSSTNIIPSGSVIIATRVGLGKVCLLNQDTAINQDLRGIFPKDEEKLSTRFLFWWLKSVAHLIVAEGTGATVQGVKLPFVKSLQIPLPPRPEQQRIVAILDEAFDAIAAARANAEQNRQNAQALFESYLQSVFSQRGDGWVERKLGDQTLLRMIDGDRGTNYPKATDFLDHGPCLFLNTKNVRPNGFEFDSTMFISAEKDAQLRKGKLQRNDVVMTTRGTIGNIGLYSEEVPFDSVRINSGMLIFRANLTEILPAYLFEILRSGIVKEQINKYTTGAAQPQLPIKTLVNFSIPVPTTLAGQSELVKRIREFEPETQRLESLYQRKIAALDELKQSLLQQAFSGQL